jgi:hypothetical protein
MEFWNGNEKHFGFQIGTKKGNKIWPGFRQELGF